MLAWYSAQFGGRVAKLKDRIDGIDLSGVWLLVQRGDAVPTQGHSIDHIGFRPLDVDAAVAELKTRNVKITTEPRPLSFPNGVTVRLGVCRSARRRAHSSSCSGQSDSFGTTHPGGAATQLNYSYSPIRCASLRPPVAARYVLSTGAALPG